MLGEVVELEIPARAEFVALARLVVSAVAADGAVPDERVDDLKLAVSEACTNAIEAYDAVAGDERVLVRCRVDDEGLEVSVEDRGPGFDPTQLPDHPPVTDPARLDFERGLGIPLIRALVDVAEFTSSPAGTQVRLLVRGAANGAEPGEG